MPLPLPYAIYLGLNPLPAAPETSSGFGSSSIPVYLWDVVIDIPQMTHFPVRAGFSEGHTGWGLGLLSQEGFFNRFEVTFRLNLDATFEIGVP
jgi:hypothetical protein